MCAGEKFRIIIPPQDINCDPRLVQRLADGDQDVYAWVYKNYSRRVYDYALMMTGDEHQSEDIVQEVFIRLWQKRERLKVVNDFNGYFYILYRNYVSDSFRNQKREKMIREEYVRQFATSGGRSEDAFSYKEREQVMRKAVKKLPKQQQLVYILSREYGFRYDRIAKFMQLSLNTVKIHAGKALKFVRGFVKVE